MGSEAPSPCSLMSGSGSSLPGLSVGISRWREPLMEHPAVYGAFHGKKQLGKTGKIWDHPSLNEGFLKGEHIKRTSQPPRSIRTWRWSPKHAVSCKFHHGKEIVATGFSVTHWTWRNQKVAKTRSESGTFV